MFHSISAETHTITVNDHHLYVSILTFNDLDADEQKIIDTVHEAYEMLADQLLSMPDINKQQSACLVTNLMPIQEYFTRETIDEWFDNATSESIQTQQTLYRLFKRPTFSIVTLPGIEEAYVQQREYEINPNANPVHVVDDLEEALMLAQQLLDLAHSR